MQGWRERNRDHLRRKGRDYYARNREVVKARQREKYVRLGKKRYCDPVIASERRRAKLRRLKEHAGGRCTICGYCRCFRALDFHHVDPGTKGFNICSDGMGYGWKRLVEEAAKCVLLCANCHREVEDGFVDLAGNLRVEHPTRDAEQLLVPRI